MTTPIFLDLALVALVTGAAWSSPLLARPTLPFGVRVPAARADDPAIVRARRRYGQGVVAVGVAAVVAVLVVAVGFDREPRPGWLVLGVAAACCALGWFAHRSVAVAKRAGDWYAGTRQAVAADTSLRTDPVRPQWALLAPAAALAVLTAGIGAWRYDDLPATLPTPDGMIVDAARRSATTVGYAFATVTAQVLIVVLVALLALAIPRSRPEIDAERPAASAARYRVYLRGVLRMLCLSAGCANASLLVASLQVWELLAANMAVTVVGYVPLAAALAAWLVFGVRVGDAGHRLSTSDDDAESGRVQRDDDRYWYVAGMVYANRQDPAVVVHRRVGAFWTLNLGHPITWAIIAVVALMAVLTGFGVIDLPRKGH